MKHHVILSAGLFVVSVLASPTDVSGQLTLGIGGGISAANWGGSDADDFSGAGIDKSSRKGVHVGAFVTIPVANRLSIAPGASYVQKGVKFSDASDELTFKPAYLEIPVLLSVALTGTDSSVPSV